MYKFILISLFQKFIFIKFNKGKKKKKKAIVQQLRRRKKRNNVI